MPCPFPPRHFPSPLPGASYHPLPTPQGLNCLCASRTAVHIPYPTVCAGNPCFGLPSLPPWAPVCYIQDPWPLATVEDVGMSGEMPSFSQVMCFQCRFTGRPVFSHSWRLLPVMISPVTADTRLGARPLSNRVAGTAVDWPDFPHGHRHHCKRPPPEEKNQDPHCLAHQVASSKAPAICSEWVGGQREAECTPPSFLLFLGNMGGGRGKYVSISPRHQGPRFYTPWGFIAAPSTQ